MTRVVGLVALLVIGIAPVVAASNVPDLTSLVGGVYDGNDGDEILCLVWDDTPAVTVHAAPLSSWVSAPLAVVPASIVAAPSPVPASDSRAPPRS